MRKGDTAMNAQNEAGAYTVREDTPYILCGTATQNRRKGERMKRKSCTISAAQPERPSDCVTVTRTGGITVTLKDCGRPNAKRSAGERVPRGTTRHDDADGYTDTS